MTDIPAKQIEEICRCALCLDVYVEPRTLPCQHSFCRECLENLVQFDRNASIIIKCPSCANIHTFRNLADMHKALKPELTLCQIIDLLKIDVGKEKQIICFKDDCGKVAISWNRTHRRFECSDCKSGPFYYNSRDIRYSNREEKMGFYCNEHQCFAKLFCNDCDKFLCHYCCQWNHRSRDHLVKGIATHNNDFRVNLQDYIGKINETIDSIQVNMEETTSFIKESLIEIETKLNKLVSDMKKTFIGLVDNYKESFWNEIKFVYDIISEGCKDELQIYSSYRKNLTDLLSADKVGMICRGECIGQSMLLEQACVDSKSHFDWNCTNKMNSSIIQKIIKQCFGTALIQRNQFSAYRVTCHGDRFLATNEVMTTRLQLSLYIPNKMVKYESDWQISNQGYKYKLECIKDQDSGEEMLSVVIQCSAEEDSSTWAVEPKVEIMIRNAKGADIIRGFTREFNQTQSRWRVSNLIKFKDLEDPNLGYSVGGKVAIEALVRV